MEISETIVAKILKASNNIDGVKNPAVDISSLNAFNWAILNIPEMENLGIDYPVLIHRMIVDHIDPAMSGRLNRVGEKKGRIVLPMIVRLMAMDTDELSDSEKDVFAERTHVEFMNSKPFLEFNGIVGRILWNIHRIKLGLSPLLIEKNCKSGIEYIKMIKEVGSYDKYILKLTQEMNRSNKYGQ